ncbi:hypothetical protein D3260_12815 [Salinisphaera sp. Q1T1-3]|nr:hypothetical protein D3260_12815 [Salinisphaera sp. Q1T1-3]
MVFARRLVDLVLFRRGPQDLPGDQSTLIASAVAYCIAQFVQIVMVAANAGPALFQALLASILLGLYAALVLRLRRLPNRFNQTATALFGAGTIITLLMLAPTHGLASYIESLRAASASAASDVATPSPLAALAYVALGIWGLAVYSHIYRHALEVPIAAGVAVTIGFEIAVLLVFSVLG